MLFFHIVVLALVQGITEFLPISSSAHLILVPLFTDWPDQGLTIDIAVHMGTLVAVMVYFWREMAMMAGGFFRLLMGRGGTNTILFLNLLIATLPAVIVGLLVYRYAGDALRNPEIIAWTTLIFGVLLYLADHFSLTVRRIEHMSFTNAFLIGLAQVLSLMPGTSRAGITMTMARMLGFERAEAARFSMLLSVPTIFGAGTLAYLDLMESGDMELGRDALLAGSLSCVAALCTIAAMMAWLRRSTFTPFAVYRVGLGIYLLFWIYT